VTKNNPGYFSLSSVFRSLVIKIRGVKKRLLFKLLLVAIVFISLLLIVESRGRLLRYFSTKCLDYRQKEFSSQLNDRVVDYSAAAKLKGSSPSSSEKELNNKISEGDLVKVRSCRLYIVDRLRFSHPAVTPDSKALLDEIARRFQEKTSINGLTGARFYITSMTRETGNLKMLRRYNSNTSRNSPHLYGNAFDISYKRFSARKMFLTNCDTKFMKEALAEVISQMRDEKRCWATYERNQNCFHVVSR
jgi:Family of unknown function (DUF5715)